MKTQLFHTLDNENVYVLLLEPFLILFHSYFL